MKVECKLHDYKTDPWQAGEGAVIVKRPWNETDQVEIIIGDKSVVVDASEMIEAIRACRKI